MGPETTTARPESSLSSAINLLPEMALPKNWRTQKLGALCDIRRGASPRPAGDSRYFGGSIPWFKIGDATANPGRFLSKAAEFVNEAGAEKSVKIPTGTLIVSNSGVSLGFAVITGCEGCVHDGWLILSPGKDADRDFLYYCINWLTGRLRGFADGTTQPNLNTGIAKSLLIPAPPLFEQREIAQTLAALDTKIELNRRTNQTLEDLARALFAHHFPHDPEDDLPNGWRASNLGEITDACRETVQPGEVTGDTPYIGLEHMPRRHIALDDWGTADGVMSGKFAFKQGDILFGKLRPYFHKVGIAPVSGVCSTDILVIRPRAPQWFGLALCHLSSDEMIAYTEANSDGTRMPRTNWQALSRYPIAIPDTLPSGFNEAITTFVDQIHANILESRTLAALRDTLLPKLLSGEIRVRDAEKLVEAKA